MEQDRQPANERKQRNEQDDDQRLGVLHLSHHSPSSALPTLFEAPRGLPSFADECDSELPQKQAFLHLLLTYFAVQQSGGTIRHSNALALVATLEYLR
jgi:hypothetical protein